MVTIDSPWLTLYGEKLKDDQGRILEYWRVEKADSVIVIPLQNQRLLLPKPSYRPGIQAMTLDFPGGRVTKGVELTLGAIAVLNKELGIESKDVVALIPINQQPWLVNSSFSSQKLYGFIAHLQANTTIDPEYLDQAYSLTSSEINQLLTQLTCLQCRSLLLDCLHSGLLKLSTIQLDSPS